jgi:hypothetical protein
VGIKVVLGVRSEVDEISKESNLLLIIFGSKNEFW